MTLLVNDLLRRKKLPVDSGSYDELSYVNNQGEYIHVVIGSVLQNLLLGAVLAIIILLFFLRDIRPTLITAISIPVSVLFAI